MDTLRARLLGGSSLQSSPIGLGALHFGVYLDARTTARLVHRALDLGINFIDTAPIYGRGNSESCIGQAIEDRRDKVLIATKVGLVERTRPDGSFGVDVEPLRSDVIRSSLEESLRELRTDYIDLYQLHAFDPATPFEETMEVLERLMEEGKVRAVGCSNYGPVELEVAIRAIGATDGTRLASCQCHYNLIERRAEEELVPACARERIGVICNRSLARGILTAKYRPGEAPPPESRGAKSERLRQWVLPETLALVSALEAWARQQGRTATELAIAWLLAKPTVLVVLVGARNLGQLETCASAANWDLTEEDMATIDGIIRSHGLETQVSQRPEQFFEK